MKIMTSTKGVCGSACETRLHVVGECPLYEEKRDEIVKKYESRDLKGDQKEFESSCGVRDEVIRILEDTKCNVGQGVRSTE